MIEAERLKDLNDAPEVQGDYVRYWMQQSQRESLIPRSKPQSRRPIG